MQGLLNRADWQAACHLPLAHVPGGSGNGLAHSCGLSDAGSCVLAAVKGSSTRLDVASVLHPPGQRLYAFLSLTYGAIANADISTEPLRWMGDTRFALGVLWVSVQATHWMSCG